MAVIDKSGIENHSCQPIRFDFLILMIFEFFILKLLFCGNIDSSNP